MLRLDARDAVAIRHDEVRAARALRDRGEARPAESAAPERGHAPLEHHRGAVAGALEEDGSEVAVAIEAQPVQDIAGEDDQARALGAEGHGLAHEIRNPSVAGVRP